MTKEEAIERLKNRYFKASMCINSEECKADNEALDIAIEALKQPEIVHCADCARYENGECYYIDAHKVKPRDFCSRSLLKKE